jgi:hypothetical protein
MSAVTDFKEIWPLTNAIAGYKALLEDLLLEIGLFNRNCGEEWPNFSC